MTTTYTTHDSNDSLWAGPDKRRCPGCDEPNDIHSLAFFKKNSARKYSTLCIRCLKAEQRFEADAAETTAIKVLSDTMQRLTRRKVGGPSFEESLSYACETMGGVEHAFGMTGRVFRKALQKACKRSATPLDIAQAVSVGKVLLTAAATSEKLKGPPINVSDLTEEEQMAILLEPAKSAILGDPKFRKLLLGDTEVRKALLAEAGVETFDVEAEG